MFAFNGAGTGSLTAASPPPSTGRPASSSASASTAMARTRDDGAYVDDVAVKCRTNAFNATSYDFMSGTSMATPHVAGAAAFLFTKFPAATVAQVKNKILRSVDRKASLDRPGRHRRPAQPLQGGGGVDGGRVGRRAALHRRGGAEEQRHGHPLRRRRRPQVQDHRSLLDQHHEPSSRARGSSRARAAPGSTTPRSSARSQASRASS